MTPRTIAARAGDKTYSIIVGLDLASELLAAVQAAGVTKVAIISDDNVAARWGGHVLSQLQNAGLAAELLTFARGESNKNQENATALQNSLLEKKFGRDSLILALGGGVTGDLAGYVASTYLRGIPYIQVPTTVLSMVDSSIGGKVGVDTPYGKNTIGSFWQPEAVIADLRFLETLSEKEITSGILEAVKCFLSADKEALALVDALSLAKPLSTPDVLQEIIARAAAFKAGVVERDEREQNERRILNFGHTIGHAIELLSNFEMPHGFAVGHGILVETKIAELLGVLSVPDCGAVHAYLKRFGVTPEGLKAYDVEQVINATKGDKKTKGGVVFYVLLRAFGVVLVKGDQYAQPVDDEIVRRAYEAVSSVH